MKQIRDKVAGLDVHRDTVVACCRIEDSKRHIKLTKRTFGTTSNGLAELGRWLSDAGVTTVSHLRPLSPSSLRSPACREPLPR